MNSNDATYHFYRLADDLTSVAASSRASVCHPCLRRVSGCRSARRPKRAVM